MTPFRRRMECASPCNIPSNRPAWATSSPAAAPRPTCATTFPSSGPGCWPGVWPWPELGRPGYALYHGRRRRRSRQQPGEQPALRPAARLSGRLLVGATGVSCSTWNTACPCSRSKRRSCPPSAWTGSISMRSSTWASLRRLEFCAADGLLRRRRSRAAPGLRRRRIRRPGFRRRQGYPARTRTRIYLRIGRSF